MAAIHSEAERRRTELSMNTATVGSHLERLRIRLAALDGNIAADRESMAELKRVLDRLEARKARLERSVAETSGWCVDFDKNIRPFEARYSRLKTSIEGLYGEAKQKHAAGLQLLIDKFDYHPAFRRWSDDFTATPFKPA